MLKNLVRRTLFWGGLVLFMLLWTSTAALGMESAAVRPTFTKEETIGFLSQSQRGLGAPMVWSLLQRPLPNGVEKQLTAQLENGLLNGFASPAELELGIVNYLKIGGDPRDFQGKDLVWELMQNAALQTSGVDGISGALVVYEILDNPVTGQVRNPPEALTDALASLQQQDGGFAAVPGGTGDVAATAKAALSLLPYHADPVAETTLQRAVAWLVQQQLEDGTFPRNGRSSSIATAAVALLDAMYTPAPSPFGKNGVSLLNAMELFYNIDGGYSAYPKGLSSVDATEYVILAQFAQMTAQNPFAAETTYPWYTSPQPAPAPDTAPDTPLTQYGKFFMRFILVLAAVFLVLPVTTKIGRMGEQGGWPGSLTRAGEDKSPAAQTDAADQILPEEDVKKVPPASSTQQPAESTQVLEVIKTQSAPKIPPKYAPCADEDTEDAEDAPVRVWGAPAEVVDIPMSPEMPDLSTLSEDDTNGAVRGGGLWHGSAGE